MDGLHLDALCSACTRSQLTNWGCFEISSLHSSQCRQDHKNPSDGSNFTAISVSELFLRCLPAFYHPGNRWAVHFWEQGDGAVPFMMCLHFPWCLDVMRLQCVYILWSFDVCILWCTRTICLYDVMIVRCLFAYYDVLIWTCCSFEWATAANV